MLICVCMLMEKDVGGCVINIVCFRICRMGYVGYGTQLQLDPEPGNLHLPGVQP